MANKFSDCTNLSTIYSYQTDPSKISLGDEVFHGDSTSTCTLYVPQGSRSSYLAADQWKNFQNILEIEATKVQNLSESHAIQYSVSGSVITLTGLTDDESASFYTADGMYLGMVKAVGSVVSFDTQVLHQTIIVRIGKSSRKISVRF